MKAERCPVCYGKGYYPPTVNDTGQVCHGCNGKGWVEVQESEIPVYYPPYPIYHPPYPSTGDDIYRPVTIWYDWEYYGRD